jgi:hypothetical protein
VLEENGKRFEKENILIDSDGDHQEYMWNFFQDSFYSQISRLI